VQQETDDSRNLERLRRKARYALSSSPQAGVVDSGRHGNGRHGDGRTQPISARGRMFEVSGCSGCA